MVDIFNVTLGANKAMSSEHAISVYTRENVPKGLRHTLALYHDETCRKKVKRAYTMGNIRGRKIDLYIVCMRKERRLRSDRAEDRVLGFLIAQERKHAMYLDVVCAVPGHGARLIELFEEEALRRGYAVAELRSVPGAEGFWKKKGYRALPPTKACGPAREKKSGDAENGYRMSKCLAKGK
tara:strand:- start:1257 stop:1799 length:543 start_codon:yes stop_codon:yes gene_type:complete